MSVECKIAGMRQSRPFTNRSLIIRSRNDSVNTAPSHARTTCQLPVTRTAAGNRAKNLKKKNIGIDSVFLKPFNQPHPVTVNDRSLKIE